MPNSLNTTVRLKGAGKWTVSVIYSLISLKSWISIVFYLPFMEPFMPGDNTFPLSNGGNEGSTKIEWKLT